MPGMQWVKLTKHHPDAFLSAGKLQPEETMQRFKLLRARAFDFGIQQLAEIPLVIPLASATCCRVQPFCLMALLNSQMTTSLISFNLL